MKTKTKEEISTALKLILDDATIAGFSIVYGIIDGKSMVTGFGGEPFDCYGVLHIIQREIDKTLDLRK